MFQETQQARQPGMYLVYILLLALLGMFIYADIQQIFLGNPFGEKPAPNAVLVIVTFLILAMLLSFYMAKLETKITDEGVFFRWPPFKNSFTLYKWEDIAKAEIIKFGFVGYGWRLTRYGMAFTIGGDSGLRLILKSGKRIIIGTQKVEEIEEILKSRKLTT